MARIFHRPMAPIVLYVGVLFVLSFTRDNSLQPDILIRIADFLNFPISSDPRTFAGAGLEVSKNGWLTPESMWIFHLWPPGFAMLLGGIFWLFGVDAPFLAILLALTIAICTFMLMTVRRYLMLHIPPLWATLLPLLPFLFPVTRFFLLQPIGLAFGEGLSVMFFILSIFFLLISVERKSISEAVWSGFFLALAAYFRSQYELLTVCMLLGALALIVLRLVVNFFSRKSNSPRKPWWGLGLMAVAVLTAQVLMLPWRIHNYIEADKLGWVQTQDLVARNALTSEAALLKGGAKFVIMGGGHLACKFEPDYCGKEDKELFYKAFFWNTGQWLQYKASLLGEYWFPSVEFFPEIVAPDYPGDYFWNSIVLAVALISFFLVFLVRRQQVAVVYFWVLASFYGCFTVVFSLVHLEVRYFFLVKIFALFCGIALAAAAWSGRFGAEASRARMGAT